MPFHINAGSAGPILPTERGVLTVASVGTSLISEVPAKPCHSPTR